MKKLLSKLKKGDTEERCGLLLRNGKVVELKNIAAEPEKGYEIAAEEILKYEDNMIASWHTHPMENSNLSERDYMGFLMWPQLDHYIIGIDGVSKYTVENGIVLNAD